MRMMRTRTTMRRKERKRIVVTWIVTLKHFLRVFIVLLTPSTLSTPSNEYRMMGHFIPATSSRRVIAGFHHQLHKVGGSHNVVTKHRLRLLLYLSHTRRHS